MKDTRTISMVVGLVVLLVLVLAISGCSYPNVKNRVQDMCLMFCRAELDIIRDVELESLEQHDTDTTGGLTRSSGSNDISPEDEREWKRRKRDHERTTRRGTSGEDER